MKNKLLTFCILLILFISTIAQNPKNIFRINAKITGLADMPVVLKINDSKGIPYTIDSTISKKGNFIFSGKISNQDMAFISLESIRKNITFFLENSDIMITGNVDSLESVKITGSKPQTDYEKFMHEMGIFAQLQEDCKNKYNKALNEGNSSEMKLYDSISTEVFNHQINFMKLFAKNNSMSIVSPYIVFTQMLYYIDFHDLDTIVSNYPANILNTFLGKKLTERVNVLRKTAIGMPFVEIALADTSGRLVRLSDLKGKYVLVDFWASWCSPCRKENPNLVNVYNKFKHKGFEIFGVSLDQNKNSWIKAIKDDGLIWTNVTDLKGWGSQAGSDYGVISIPHSVLIDKNGIIIAKDLRGDLLLKKLTELLP
jgi:peroxiredoxin